MENKERYILWGAIALLMFTITVDFMTIILLKNKASNHEAIHQALRDMNVHEWCDKTYGEEE